ncbi:LysE family translocator [Arenibaculum pallidiluteum]|uniref:LysE family translocator n=1 Tax=Arenibaculum pallidiluteum TaxID=2812559 RepID=UPI001A975DD4|nr:LysE family translocator [Arenibaculum pallidiluteum]
MTMLLQPPVPWDDLLMVYGAYLIATASPGPSNMAIMGVAMNAGRRQALTLAAGVMTGSMFWATLAGTGVSVVLASYAQVLTAIKLLGGLYLLYLAWRSARSAMAGGAPRPQGGGTQRDGLPAIYLQGLLLHLTNPKAILAWLAIMSLGLGDSGHASAVPAIIGGCAGLGVMVFGGYALVFSTGPMVRLYARARRWLEAVLALFFGFAGLRLLLSRS